MAEDIQEASNDNKDEVFVSYAWGGESEEIVNSLEKAFAKSEIRIIRDKNEVQYNDSIREFEDRIGKARFIIMVIGDKYLKSPYCMNNLVDIDRNKNFRDRTFPIILSDAQIFSPVDRLKYSKYWDEKIEDLESALEEANSSKTTGTHAELDRYKYFRENIDRLLTILSDMNSMSSDSHVSSNFSELIAAVTKTINAKKTASRFEKETNVGGITNGENNTVTGIKNQSPKRESATSNNSLQELRRGSVKIINAVDSKMMGTGFIIESNLVCTCAHVLGSFEQDSVFASIFADGEREYGTVLYSNKESDLAILSINMISAGGSKLRLGESQNSEGHLAGIYGFPYSDQGDGKYAEGKILDLVTDENGRRSLRIQSSTIEPGMSGSAVLDEERNIVVGMIFAHSKESGGEFEYAIPAEQIQQALLDNNLLHTQPETSRPYHIEYGYGTLDKHAVTDKLQTAKRTFLLQSDRTRIDVYFGGNPPSLVPWELEVDTLVLPVGTTGSLSGKMATDFLDALGQQRQNFLALLETERTSRQSTQTQPELSRFITPETPLLLDTEGNFPDIKSRYIIAATAYQHDVSQTQNKSQKNIVQEDDESQDTPDVFSAGDAAEAIIRLAEENKLSRLAIPLLGTGAAGLPSIDVAREMLAAIRDATLNTSIQQITLLTLDWEVYNYLDGLVKHKPQKSYNDLSEGDDRLKVKEEMDALADTLLLAETGTPLAVGILGGWGSGKSFAMRMLYERMAEIRSMAASDDYVGHPYLIDFDAWTFTKSNLWSSLMQTIFLELNRQLEREETLATGLGAHALEEVRAIYSGTKTQLSDSNAASEVLWQQLQEHRSVERKKLEKQEKLLEEKHAELETKHKEIINTVDNAIQKDIKDAVWKPLADVLSKPFGKSWKAFFFGRKVEHEERVPYAFRSWAEFSAFALFALAAILVPVLVQRFQEFQYPGILLAIGSSVIGMLRTFDRWKAEVYESREEIKKSRDARLKEKLEERKNIFNDIENEIKTLEVKVSEARRLAGVTATFDSLLELCQARLRQADYENELGLMHRVKLDLDEMDWALKKAQNQSSDNLPDIFPRGKPRIVLFIDDLDRCPPERVVEVLEATQLLLKTKLFVVVLAMDIRYVTRALEKAYAGILAREGDPSGLDYIEKIIQIPYQVRPVAPEVVGDYISSMMTVRLDIPQRLDTASNVARTSEERATSESNEVNNSELKVGTSVKPKKARKPRTLVTLSQVVTFSKDEYDFLVLCCQQVNLTPRAIKRLINVYKLLKILWSRELQWPQPDPSVEQAVVLLLALSCAYPDAMREAFVKIENEIPKITLEIIPEKSFSEFFAATPPSESSKFSKKQWYKLQDDLQNFWENEDSAQKADILKALPISEIQDVLTLARSFSFVGDLGS
jgi:predicted KAP-like P-loop ATPase